MAESAEWQSQLKAPDRRRQARARYDRSTVVLAEFRQYVSPPLAASAELRLDRRCLRQRQRVAPAAAMRPPPTGLAAIKPAGHPVRGRVRQERACHADR